MKRSVLAIIACAVASVAMAQNDPKVWAWDFPMYMDIQLQAGQQALTCQRHYFDAVKEGEGVAKQSMMWYDTTIDQPGKEKSVINEYGDKIEVPNTLIIPLGKTPKAKKGDIVLTHHRYHDMQRAIVIDASTPTEPVVCYLDESWPDKVDSSQLPEKLKGDKLQPGSFNVLKEGTFESGAQVAYKKEGEWKNGIVLQVSGDKLLVTGFASRIDCVAKGDCTLIPFKEKLKEGDDVYVVSSTCYEPDFKVVKVDMEHGHVWVQYKTSKYTHCYGLPNVTKVLK